METFFLVKVHCNVYQLCPTQMAYWAKNYVTVLARAAHWM